MTIDDKLTAIVADLVKLAHTLNLDGSHQDALVAQGAIAAVRDLHDEISIGEMDWEWQPEPTAGPAQEQGDG